MTPRVFPAWCVVRCHCDRFVCTLLVDGRSECDPVACCWHVSWLESGGRSRLAIYGIRAHADCQHSGMRTLWVVMLLDTFVGLNACGV